MSLLRKTKIHLTELGRKEQHSSKVEDPLNTSFHSRKPKVCLTDHSIKKHY